MDFKKLITLAAEDLDEQETPSARIVKGFNWNDPVSGQAVQIDPVQKDAGAMADPNKYLVEGGNTSALAPQAMGLVDSGISSSVGSEMMKPDAKQLVSDPLAVPKQDEALATPVSSPGMTQLDARAMLTDPLAAKKSRLEHLSTEPIKPEKKWKDVLAYIFGGINAAFNPNPNNKIVGYGRIKRDNEIRQVSEDIARIEGMHSRQLDRERKEAETADIKDKPQKERRALVAKLTIENEKQKKRIELLAEKKRLEDSSFDKMTLINGKWFELYKDGRRIPATNPTTGEQEVEAGEQEVIDPLTGNTVKAKQILQPQAMIASADASRQQSTDQFNAGKQFDAIKTNISNEMKYQDDVRAQNNAIIAAANLGSDAEIAGLRTIAEQKAQAYLTHGNGAIPQDDKEADAWVKEGNKLADEAEKANKAVFDAINRTESGRQKAAELRQNMPTRPPKLTYTPIKSVQVGGKGVYSGQVFQSVQAARQFFPNKTDDEIRRIVTSNGGRFAN